MKYIIEIENEPFGRNDDPFFPHGMDELYRAKGFKSLVFDQNGLNKLTPYTEPDEQKIIDKAHEGAWEFARMVRRMNISDWIECFEQNTLAGIFDLDYSEAKAKYDAWKKQKYEIRVGDEVDVAGTIGVVVRIPEGDEQRIHYIAPSGAVYCNNAYADIIKTGRHFPEVAELLKKIREE